VTTTRKFDGPTNAKRAVLLMLDPGAQLYTATCFGMPVEGYFRDGSAVVRIAGKAPEELRNSIAEQWFLRGASKIGWLKPGDPYTLHRTHIDGTAGDRIYYVEMERKDTDYREDTDNGTAEA
jgi:hypothetical protein